MKEYTERYDDSGRLIPVWFNPHITLEKAGSNAEFVVNYKFKKLKNVESFEQGIRLGEMLVSEEIKKDSVELSERELDSIIKSLSKKRLFVDIDGTLAEFRVVDTLETLYEKRYFATLNPHYNVINAVKHIKNEHPEIEVYVLSAYLKDSLYALDEKNEWLDTYLPEIDKEHRIFTPCGENKKNYIPGIWATDFLLDDYSHNLNAWEPPAKGIKIMNGINGTKGTWESDKLSMAKTGEELAANIVNIMEGKAHYQDQGPQSIERSAVLLRRGR